MAGVKGRSGGARPGAGRKPKVASEAAKATAQPGAQTAAGAGLSDAKEFLEGVIQGRILASEAELRAATALLPYQHKKLGESGKKEKQQEEASKLGGRFAAAPPPRLAARDGKRI